VHGGFVIGTRGSRLALSQSELITASLCKAFPDLAIRTQIIRTTGDRQPDLSIGELSGVGFFVKELELALHERTIDAAVHSMKDLPSTDTAGLVIAAIAERDDPRDALVARGGMTVGMLPRGARVGTSSVRRAACLLAMRADLTIVPMRGNVDTRVKKVDAGVLSFPTSYYAERTGLKTLYDFAESGGEIPTTTVAISREYGRKNRDSVLRFLRAYLEGHKRLLTDRALSIRALRKYGGIAEEETLAHTYDLFSTKIVRKVPNISTKSVDNALKLLGENMPKAKERKASEFIDTSYMEELERTGFIKSLWP